MEWMSGRVDEQMSTEVEEGVDEWIRQDISESRGRRWMDGR